jgi:hypothetical protein
MDFYAHFIQYKSQSMITKMQTKSKLNAKMTKIKDENNIKKDEK